MRRKGREEGRGRGRWLGRRDTNREEGKQYCDNVRVGGLITEAAFKSPKVGTHKVCGSFKDNVYKVPREPSIYVLTIVFINVVVMMTLTMMKNLV